MERLHKIRDLDDLIFEEFQKYFPKTTKSTFAREHPSTLHITNLFTISTNFIKNSIFDCSEVNDVFGVKILYRSLIEHFLRFKYVNFNWMMEQDDEISRRYLAFTEAREKLDQIKIAIAEHKLSDPKYKVESWKEIFEEIPDLKKYSKNQIEQETLKYTYKNIIRTLKVIDEKSGKETPLFRGLIREYSELSSYVHGGAGAHNQMFKFVEDKKRSEELIRICALSYQMAGTVKLFTLLMMIQTDKEDFTEHYLEIDKVLKKVHEI